MTTRLEVFGLKLDLKKRSILKDLSFTIAPGWFGILGVNGSGKTTLLKALCARLPISGGEIRYKGKDITDNEANRAKIFSFAPDIHSLPPNLTAKELILLLADLKQVSPFEPSALYTILGLSHIDDKLIGAMSSGMRQRVSLFCAFLGTPEVVLLDEPFNWLDPVAAYDLKRELRAYIDGARCIVTTLHDVETFVTRCDQGILIHQGKILRLFDQQQMCTGRTRVGEMEAEIYNLFPR
ncbi:ABC transporter ATP-binding protein [Asticcacaulis sp. 201]|uniref:ABC transporter ATP-binding protein n=1 Tax=Asticcacaulis sp. 201 TaxID=3028787 RepID=UPI002915CA3D|nr:ABC transporter ATP-binding protein [Asticcacaulis sp. 201]MDV6331875.1 ABC transporter ATP-binding protein [Asticcacaulis sp. 201]